MWLEQSLNQFKEALLNYYQPSRASGHAPLERMGAASPIINSGASTPSNLNAPNIALSPTKKNVLESLGKLMSACVVLRLEDFTLHRVTTAEKKQMPKEFLSGEWK